jgi:hypothetical protein
MNHNYKSFYTHPLIDIDFNQTSVKYYENKIDELESHYRVSFVVDAKWLENSISGLKIGDKATKIPNFPENPKEAFELFKNYFAYSIFLGFVISHLQSNIEKWDNDCINPELKRLNEFIDKTKGIEPAKAFGWGNGIPDNERYYIRLDKGYYEKNNIKIDYIYNKVVYAQYFLFRNLLLDKLNHQQDICNVPRIKENIHVSNNILYAYYNQIRQPQSRDEVPEYYIGRLWRYNDPYHYTVHGAYIFTPVWEMLECKKEDKSDQTKDYTHKKVSESLKDYAKGFQYGFDNFLKDKIKKPTSLANTDELNCQLIKDYVTQFWYPGSLSETHNSDKDIFSGWYNNGVEAGYYYCAWYLIFENYRLFEPYFKDYSPPQEIQYVCNLSRNSILEIKKEIFDKVPKDFTEESDEIWLNRFIIDNTISKTNVFGNTKGKKDFTTANEYLTALVEIISENLINKGFTALERDRFINDKFKITKISRNKNQITNRQNEYESTKAKLKNMFSETT